jgi:predicted Zn finger-like uncharacterized protein
VLPVCTESDLSVYTQCSNCQTIFKLSAEVLRAASGQVRCGRCGEVFSALARLSEDASSFATGESPLDLEQRADNILESVIIEDVLDATPEVPPEQNDTGVEIAHLQILDFSDDADESAGVSSMEFTLPPGELDRIFVESKTGKRPPFPLGKMTSAAELTSSAAPVEPASAPTAPVPPVSTAPKPRVVPHPEELAATLSAERLPEEEEEIPGLEVIRDHREQRGAPGGGLVSDAVRRQMFSTGPMPVFDLDERPPASRKSIALWVAAAILAALLLAVQLIHQNREWLASHGPLGPLLRSLYSSVGVPVAVPANLAAYELRQWGVTGDPVAGGTLKVRSSIMNTSAQLVPFPLLRVTLANRYGAHIGTRDFEPSEYLGKPTARLLAPGERVDATVQILDPGKDAEGFEIDVCLRTAEKKIICATDAATPQAKR